MIITLLSGCAVVISVNCNTIVGIVEVIIIIVVVVVIIIIGPVIFITVFLITL